MKISVGIPSRGRPLELAASVLALHKTKSDAHSVEYLIGHDHNDPDTMEVVSRLVAMGLPVRSSFGPRPLGLGEIHNRLIAESDPESVFILWTDRCVPVTMQWDHALAMGAMEFPTRVLWLDSVHLVGPGQFAIPPRLRAAQPDDRITPGIFPFWYEDSAVEEIDIFTHGQPRVQTNAHCAGPRTDKTNRCRDIAFWCTVFARTRPQRLARAARIARNLGLPFGNLSQQIAWFEQRDVAFIARADILTEQYSAGGPPDDTYLAAKDQAERILAEMLA